MSDELLRWILLVDVLVLLIPSYLISIYVDHTILPQVEAQLGNCRIIADTRAFWGTTSRFARSQRLIAVNLALTSTGRLAKSGWVDVQEVRGISAANRRWIVIPTHVGGLSIGVLLILFLIDKFC